MTLWDRILNLVGRPPNRTYSPGPLYVRAVGEPITPETALNFSAVWACVRVISETISSLGWHVVKELDDGTRERQRDTNLDRLLNVMANREMTAFAWRDTALVHALIAGNHYSEIERTFSGKALGMWPIDPATVQVVRDQNGALLYRVTDYVGGQRLIEPRNMIHIRGIGWDGEVGMSVIGSARRSIGMGLALDKFGGAFYENGAHTGLVLQHPHKLSEAAKQNLKTTFKEEHGGAGKAFKTIVLEEGMDIKQVSMSMVDAQFLESRKFQVSEICRWFRVPPHKVADLERATFSNIEHQSIEFVQDTILPWCRRLEQEIDAKLTVPWALSTRLNIDTLLRGDIVARYTAYEKGRNGGWLSANDVRRLENLPPIENGDIYLQPMNMVEAGEKPEPAEAAPAAEPATDAEQPQQPADGEDALDFLRHWKPPAPKVARTRKRKEH